MLTGMRANSSWPIDLFAPDLVANHTAHRRTPHGANGTATGQDSACHGANASARNYVAISVRQVRAATQRQKKRNSHGTRDKLTHCFHETSCCY